jgi:acetyl-CoA synthetase
MVQDHKVTLLGIVPSLARGLRKYGDKEVARYDLSSVRAILSSAEPWDRESWMWVFENVCARSVPILNFSGGTEMFCLVSTNILFPIKPGGFHGGLPGMGADIVDNEGKSMPPGELGELVMREASIGTTRGLWKDRQRYLESYWQTIPGMWVQGDFASRDEDGCWYLHGRSDDTIKVSGKRVGPSELEQILMGTGAVTESAVVGVPDRLTGSAIVCIVVPAPGHTGEAALAGRLSQAITRGMGTSFRPRRIIFVRDLPKTRTMKVMRRVVRSVLTGQPAGDVSSLVNPEAVDELRAVAGTQGG